jgi:hypothetical protein
MFTTKPVMLRNGRYRGPLIIYTIAQHLIDTENTIHVPGLIEESNFPKAALALSVVAAQSYQLKLIQMLTILSGTPCPRTLAERLHNL